MCAYTELSDIYEELCSYKNLELAFNKARKGKTQKSYVIEFEKDLKNNLLLLRTELLLHNYKPQPLKTFIKEIVINIMRDLKRARPIDVYKQYEKSYKGDIKFTYRTLINYMEDMANNDKTLSRTVLFDNADKVKKKQSTQNRQICLYGLNLENP